MPGTPAHVWHPWLRTERVLRAILTEPWSAEAWERIKLEIPEILAEHARIRKAGWSN